MPSERGLPPGEDGDGGDGKDAELDAALKDFDGEILAEREVIQARANETAANTSGAPALPGDDSTTAGGGTPSASGTPSPGGQLPGGIGGPRARSAPPSPTAQSSVPEDIPDARDDDVVARQLREAAMNETDPELKEKLWEEYRRYKGS